MIFFSCNKDKEKAERMLAQLCEEYYAERLFLYPLEATMIGDSSYNHVFHNDLSKSHRQRLKDFYDRYLEKLKKINKRLLSDSSLLNYEILWWECSMQREELNFPSELLPLNHFESMHLTMAQLGSGDYVQPFKTVKDYENWLCRLEGFTAWCDTAIANMKQGIRQGYTLPRIVAEKVIPQLEEMAKGPAEAHLFYRPVTRMPEFFPAVDRQRLTTAYRTMIQEKIIPVCQRLLDFFVTEYLPACRESHGLGALPGGKEWYAFKVRYYTTTSMTPEEIFETGCREVERIKEEMVKVKKETGYSGDLISFFHSIRNNKKLMPYHTADEVIDHFRRIAASVHDSLFNLFFQYPKTPFEIRRTESFREATASAEYIPGSWDGTRPGIFYVPVPDASSYNTYADEDLFLHEVIPGHHYQLSLQQENTRLPGFRRSLWYGAYGEGWALYAESLGKALGLYKDPFQYFGMLSMEMHRALRLVIDAGIHYKGWTREQAIRYSLQHEAEPEQNIIREVERYMVYPGQALSYKTGEIKIRELRRKAEKELGEKFDLREFHQQVLEEGCLPLVLLEKKIQQWIEKKKGQSPNKNG